MLGIPAVANSSARCSRKNIYITKIMLCTIYSDVSIFLFVGLCAVQIQEFIHSIFYFFLIQFSKNVFCLI